MTIDYRKPARIDYRKRPGGTAATGLERVADHAPGLVDLFKTAAVSLVKNRVSGQRAAVYLVLDRIAGWLRQRGIGTLEPERGVS